MNLTTKCLASIALSPVESNTVFTCSLAALLAGSKLGGVPPSDFLASWEQAWRRTTKWFWVGVETSLNHPLP